MSTQAERIRAFKHSQLTKIQKKEEEEWLSGEELCTEGSSDEETTHKTNIERKAKKQTVSPLVRDHISVSETATPHTREEGKSSCVDIGSHLEKGDCEADTDLKILWRPKRGSLQLPTSSEDHLQYSAYYTELIETIQFLMPTTNERQLSTDTNCLSSDEEILKNLIEGVTACDSKLKETSEVWKRVREERMRLEQEMGKAIQESSLPLEKNSLVLFNFENKLSNLEKRCDTKANGEKRAKSSSNLCSDKDFVARNIELAKHGIMATFSLTDEEKSKLETLLSDIENEECCEKQVAEVSGGTNEHETEKEDEEDDKDDGIKNNVVNEFQLSSEDQKRMEELDARMEEILDAFPEELRKEAEKLQTNDDPFKHISRSGRLWKYAELDDRIKAIDNQLEALLSDDRGLLTQDGRNGELQADCNDI